MLTTERQTELISQAAELARQLAAVMASILAEIQIKPLERFLREQCHEVPGARIPYRDFYLRFATWLDAQGIDGRGQGRGNVRKMLPPQFPYGVGAHNVRCVGNLAWQPGPAVGPALIAVGGRLTVSRRWAKT